MEQQAKLKMHMNTYHHLNNQYKITENLLKQNHLLNLKLYKSQEKLFREKFDQQRKTFQQSPSPSKQISDDHHDEQKANLLKQFDELKHTINDPYSALSALAALSRSLAYLDSKIK